MAFYQKYHLKWPWTPTQVNNLDDMLGTLFSGLATVTAAEIAAANTKVTSDGGTTIIIHESAEDTSFPDFSTPTIGLGDPVTAVHGGTGLNTFAVGDLLYASATTALSRLADVATGSVLVSGGVGVAPSWNTSPTLTKVLVDDGLSTAPAYTFTNSTTSGLYWRGGTIEMAIAGSKPYQFGSGTLVIGTAGGLGFSSGDVTTISPDVFITRDAANVLAARNGANAQTLRLYAAFTNASNFGRANIITDGLTGLTFQVQNLGTAGIGGNVVFDAATGGVTEFRINGAAKWRIDGSGNFIAQGADNTFSIGESGAHRPKDYFGAGKITSAGATAGIGYVTGAGGAVTQLTSKATGVTLNTVTGQITMQAAALAAGAKVSFVVTDSAIVATDLVIVSIAGGGTANAYRADVTAVAASSFTITVENLTAGPLSESPVINFAVIKGVAA